MKRYLQVLLVFLSLGSINAQTVDSITDVRDGQVYRTVEIGTQWWMGENLNVGTRINGSTNQSDNGIIEKYAYGNQEANADTFGGLYLWNEAMNYSTTEGAQGICPDGWHMPSDDEWKTLEMYLGMSQSDADQMNEWRGTDQGTQLKEGGTSGFEALLAGRHFDGSYNFMGSYVYFWTSTQYGSGTAWHRFLGSSQAGVNRNAYNTWQYGLCVRCAKDGPHGIIAPPMGRHDRRGMDADRKRGVYSINGSRCVGIGTGIYIIVVDGQNVARRTYVGNQ